MFRVLLVDNSATSRYVLSKLLQQHNCRVTVAVDAMDAMGMLSNPREEEGYDGVILGWPLGLDADSAALASLVQLSVQQARGVILLNPEQQVAPPEWAVDHPRVEILSRTHYPDAVKVIVQLLAGTPKAMPSMLDLMMSHKKAAEDEETGGAVRVLLVDDSPSARTVYRQLLEANGYWVDTAFSVADAMEKAMSVPLDIVIVDYFMPDANGDELCHRLQQHPRTQHLLSAVLTSSYEEVVIKESLAAGATDCFFKNETQALLLARIDVMRRTVQQRRSISAEREKLAGILCSVGEGVYGVNEAGQVTFINPAARAMLGYDEEDMVSGSMARDVLHGAGLNRRDSEHCPLLQAYGTQQELIAEEAVLWSREGRPIPVEYTLLPLNVQGRQEGSVVAFRDISHRRHDGKQWTRTHDAVTGLWKRARFEQHLEDSIGRIVEGQERPQALLHLDIDGFSAINAEGRPVSDGVLTEAARRLRARMRDGDFIARLDNDEFVLLLKGVDCAALATVGDYYRRTLEQASLAYAGEEYDLTASVGAIMVDGEERNVQRVMELAAQACHRAHSDGRNRTVVLRGHNPELSMPLKVSA